MIEKIINEIISKLKENKSQLEKVEKIDKKYNNLSINFENIIKYIEHYRNEEIKEKNERIIAIYRGNPYITIDLCMQAIINNCKLVLITEDVMYGMNLLITQIFKSVVKDMIIYKNCIQNKKIIEISSKFDRILVIGDTLRYQCLRGKIKNIEFIKYNNIAIYLDDEKFEEIADKICEYGDEYEDDIEIYTENMENIAKDIFVEKVLILSENKKLIENAKKVLKDKEILINRNPLEKLINKDYISEESK